MVPTAQPDQAAIRLRALTDLARALARVHSFPEVIKVAAEESRRALEARVVSISEYVRATGQLRVLINHGELLPSEERYPEDEWYEPSDFPRIVSEDYPRPWIQLAEEGTGDPRRVASLQLGGRYSALIAPIFFAGQVWGELYPVARRLVNRGMWRSVLPTLPLRTRNQRLPATRCW